MNRTLIKTTHGDYNVTEKAIALLEQLRYHVDGTPVDGWIRVYHEMPLNDIVNEIWIRPKDILAVIETHNDNIG